MDFKELLLLAKNGDRQAVSALWSMYTPMLHRAAVLSGRYDEDLFQELCITFLKCVQMFRIP